MKHKYITIYYFSGTGNTSLIANKIYETFQVYQHSAVLRNMAKTDVVELPEKCVLGLVFPVAIQSTFPIVWEFIEKLPAGEGREVFMADTMESYSGGIVGPLKRKLTQKGYICIGAKEFKMSSSMQTKKRQKFEGKIKDERAEIQAEKYVRDLIAGMTSWRRIPILSDAMRHISKSPDIWRSMSKKITIDHEKCVMCNLCVHYCPRGALSSFDGKIVMDHDACISCMRCANYCPKNAYKLNGKFVIQKRIMPISNI